jgi:hypothetical protein
MKIVLGFLFYLIVEPVFASPMFEGLTWMTNVGVGVAILNLISGIFIMQFFLQTQRKAILKSVIFGTVQLVLTMVSIPASWIGTSWLIYWIKELESFTNVLYISGLFVLPGILSAYAIMIYRKSAR